jgi:hypothetical protein
VSTPAVARVDRYAIEVDGLRVRATDDQERRIAALSDEQRARFVAIMGGA